MALGVPDLSGKRTELKIFDIDHHVVHNVKFRIQYTKM